ncbi:hypothetical protein Patl1_10638 [Pistacia atlantica]|uniref:Uncharacterized protein n=1 Tax=Pistacia atlantica TaxID=434234 RepID=A0ACC1A277_9ROSI|nr:hypothetical protein Patl1_10638 [Pistacia atlantica]
MGEMVKVLMYTVKFLNPDEDICIGSDVYTVFSDGGLSLAIPGFMLLTQLSAVRFALYPIAGMSITQLLRYLSRVGPHGPFSLL